MDPLSAFERFAVQAIRPARRLYRYLTGDQTCLGFVRLMCMIMLLLDIAAAIAYLRESDLRLGGFALAGSVIVLVALGPQLFRTAASTDRSPIGPGIEARAGFATGLDAALTAGFIGGVLYNVVIAVLGTPLRPGDVLALLGYPSFVLAIWATRDRDGGKGERTLSKDLRRLTRRSGPEIVGGNVGRQPVPVRVDG